MEIADALVTEIDEVLEAHVLLVSRIGQPIADPKAVHLRLRTALPDRVSRLSPPARTIVDRHPAGLETLWERLLTRHLATDVPGA
jgi:S-adenosylmethionine synthetase